MVDGRPVADEERQGGSESGSEGEMNQDSSRKRLDRGERRARAENEEAAGTVASARTDNSSGNGASAERRRGGRRGRGRRGSRGARGTRGTRGTRDGRGGGRARAANDGSEGGEETASVAGKSASVAARGAAEDAASVGRAAATTAMPISVGPVVLRVRSPPRPRKKGGQTIKRAASNSAEEGTRTLTDTETAGRSGYRREGSDGVGISEEAADVIIVDSDEEERAAQDRLKNDNPLLAPEVDLNNYRQCILEIDVSLISEPKQSIRLVDEEHLREMRQSIKENGYMTSSGTLSVTLKEGNGLTCALAEEMITNGKITREVWLIDGRHRLIVIIRERIQTVKVTLWIPRRDVPCLHSAEIVSIGAFLNKSTSTNREMTLQDQIHACVSLARTLDAREDVDIRASNSSHLATALFAGKTLGKQKMRQLQRYGMIGLKLAQNQAMFDIFLEETNTQLNLNLSHVASDVLLGMDLEGFRLGLQCVKQRIETANQTGWRATGRFDRLSRAFYNAVAEQYGEVKKAAEFCGWPVREFLQRTVGKTKVTVGESIRTGMGRFDEGQKMKGVMKTKLTNLKKRLKALPGVEDYEAESESDSEVEGGCITLTNSESSGRNDGDHEQESESPRGTPPNSKPGDSLRPKQTPGPAQNSELAKEPKQPQGNGTKQTEGSSQRPKRKSKKRNYSERGEDEEDFEPDSGRGRQRKKPKIAGTGKDDVNPAATDEGSGYMPRDDLVRALEGLPENEVIRIMDALGLDVVSRPEKETVRDEGKFASTDGSGFKDEVAAVLPIGYDDPVPYEGLEHPQWCRFAFLFPSQWPKKNPIGHAMPFLETILVPHEHRANVFFNSAADVLRDNHHLVFWRAALNYLVDHPQEEVVPDGDERFTEVPKNLLPWASAIANDYAALAYFAEKRGELESQGYCVLSNFLDDGRNPEKVGSVTIPQMDGDRHVFSRLRAEVQASFPGAQALRDPDNRTVWNWIVNEGFDVDAVKGEKGIARYTTTNFGVTTHLEQNASTVLTARLRALLDIRISQALAALVVWKNKSGSEEMYIPKTGGRWLLTAKGCKRQALHTDFPSMSRTDTVRGKRNPGYFTITTGSLEVPVWVCPFSHKTVSMAPERGIRAMSKGSVAGILRIPPYSIFVGRGDMFHAGAGYGDSAGDGSCLRYHLYFVPMSHRLEDGVHMLQKFDPIMKTNLDDDTDEDVNEGEDDATGEVVGEGDVDGDDGYVDDVEADGEGDDVVMKEGVPATQPVQILKEGSSTAKAAVGPSGGNPVQLPIPDTQEQEVTPDLDEYEEKKSD